MVGFADESLPGSMDSATGNLFTPFCTEESVAPMPSTRLLFAGRVAHLEIFVRAENALLRLKPKWLREVLLPGASSEALILWDSLLRILKRRISPSMNRIDIL